MKILAIETSCDDTGIAILETGKKSGFKVLSNIIASQIEIHKQYGGVFPAMAKREHQRNILPSLIQSLKKAGMLKPQKYITSEKTNLKLQKIVNILEREQELLEKIIPFLKKYKKPNIDLISITNGPGLEPCLWVGVNFAKALAFYWDIPVVPVNHVESHILVNFLEQTKDQIIKFPAVALVVSGGHTQITLVKNIGKYKILGETRDDAAGECFDKCAKLLGLGYPGGPIISKMAEGIKMPTAKSRQGRGLAKKSEPSNIHDGKAIGTKISLPRPMIGTKDYDFSFSGLKTAVLYADRKIINKNKKYKVQMAAEVQQAIIDVLIKKTMKAVKDFNVKSLILGGGVSANQELRKQFKEKLKKGCLDTKLFIPKPNLSTDNAVMTAITGFYHKKNTKGWQKIRVDSNLRIG